MRRLSFAFLCLAVLALTAVHPSAQTRTIRVVVPYGPGGAPDVLARLLGEEIARARGVTMVVENRPGAGAIIGTEAVMRAPPDGNTLLIVANAFLANPHLRMVAYDPVASFEPICHLVSVPSLIVVNAASPYRTLGDLLDAARASPGKISLASPGPATTFHVALESLKRAANVNVTYVPYPTTPPALTALVGGHVTAVFSDYASILGSLKSGNVRAIATASANRLPQLPDVPTVIEGGYKDFEFDVWFGISAPAKTPKDTVAELIAWYSAALRVDAVRQKLTGQALQPVGRCGSEFAASLRTQYDVLGRIIREAGVKAE